MDGMAESWREMMASVVEVGVGHGEFLAARQRRAMYNNQVKRATVGAETYYVSYQDLPHVITFSQTSYQLVWLGHLTRTVDLVPCVMDIADQSLFFLGLASVS